MRGISAVGRTKFSEVRPTLKAVNGESAQNSPGIFGALAQLVARDIRIVEARGSNPLYSTTFKKLWNRLIPELFFVFSNLFYAFSSFIMSFSVVSVAILDRNSVGLFVSTPEFIF